MTTPRVGIIMGSDSDLPVMEAAASILAELDVPYELTIVSAHRTPQRMFEYARGAASRGLQVIIAGAGGAAHLPGMVASLTPLPVIGVPVRTTALSGQDSLLSIVQMPAGIPVATVAIDNAQNAGLLAARILGAGDMRIRERVEQHTRDLEAKVNEKIAALEEREADRDR
jgi:5-(carboxyamino)imidazole ribonucleotide mutase